MESQRLIELYKKLKGCEPSSVEKLQGAGSNRQYYRIHSTASDESVIGVIGTSAEENYAFIEIAKHFEKHKLYTPRVYAYTDDYMVYLQEDLGNTSLFDYLKEARETGNYGTREFNKLSLVISELPQIQFEGGSKTLFKKCYPQSEMDEVSVMFDLNYFKYNYLKLTSVEFNEYKLQSDFNKFCEDLLKENADTFLYRDFQARNVMLKDGQPYFIDFQGGRKGPIYYDVASFLWQASARYPEDLRNKLISEYYHSLEYYIDDSRCPECYRHLTKKKFIERLHTFVLFRTLQVLGAYGYRGLWEKKQHFIDSIPPALENLKEEITRGTCDSYPYLKEICQKLIEAGNKKEEEKPAESKTASYLSQDKSYLKEAERPLVVRVNSFSFKRGIPKDETPNGGGYVFDCRATHNPGRYAEYKELTGLDKPVIDFLEEDGEILQFLDSCYKLVDFHTQRFIDRGFTDLMISCGCTGGRHRSVYSAQHIAEHLNSKFGVEVHITHREQGITQILNAHAK